ncbi:MAG: hypothetical protein EXS13_10450 [Planctomycetes bacterium]|nr:hypothetical protein [Planctomycetota bacterium]
MKDAALDRGEQAEDLLGGGVPLPSLLRVERQILDPLLSHCASHLAFDQRLNQERQEVEVEERFDPPFVLEQHGRDLEDGLELLEPLLEGGLALMRGEPILRLERAVIGEEGVHAVGVVVVGDGGVVGCPLGDPGAAGL